MLTVRCIVGDLRGGLLRCLSQQRRPLSAHPQGPNMLFSKSPQVSDCQHVRLSGSHGRVPLLTQRSFSSQGQNPSLKAAKVKLRTRLFVTLLFGGSLLGCCWYVYLEKEERLRGHRIEQLKKVAVGQGTFSLLDHTGRRRTKQDFLGSWVLLYFGFTHCPDICPDELEKMSAVVATLDQDPALPQVQPLFITVDPERDDVPALAHYVKDFHPRLIGLTGTDDEVKHAGRDYRVYASPGPKDVDGDYIVDHTILIYLISPDGLFLDYYNRMKDQQHITDSIRNHIKTYKLLSPTLQDIKTK